MRSHNFAVHAVCMAENEYQRPEGRLLAAAIARSGKSARRLAADMVITDSRLRHIVNGYQPVGRGQKVVVVAPAETLAQVSQVLGVTPEQLDGAGRHDAADILRTLVETDGTRVVKVEGDFRAWIETTDVLSDFQRRELLRVMDQMQATGSTRGRMLPNPSDVPEGDLKERYVEAIARDDPLLDVARIPDRAEAVRHAQAELDRESLTEKELLDIEAAKEAAKYVRDAPSGDSDNLEQGSA